MKPSATEVTTSRVTVDQILVTMENGWWAKIQLEEESGSVVIQSDYGNWSCFWPPGGRGDKTLPEFLLWIDVGYAMGVLAKTMESMDFSSFWSRIWVPYVRPALLNLKTGPEESQAGGPDAKEMT